MTSANKDKIKTLNCFLDKKNLLIDLAADFRLNNKKDYEKLEKKVFAVKKG